MFFMKGPYSSYLPIEYKISTVSKYAKTCYLPYGYEMMNYIFDTSLNVDFFRYLHIFLRIVMLQNLLIKKEHLYLID